MAKAKKDKPAPKKEPVQEVVAPEVLGGPVMNEPIMVEIPRERLWELYLARVAKAETVHTVLRSGEKIFGDALAEAKVALKVWEESEVKNHE